MDGREVDSKKGEGKEGGRKAWRKAGRKEGRQAHKEASKQGRKQERKKEAAMTNLRDLSQLFESNFRVARREGWRL